MKIVISPAKSLNFEKEIPTNVFSEPLFLKQATTIQRTLKKNKKSSSIPKYITPEDGDSCE